jgi:murein DD-endopeptidase MepM/ murein hydrolase activator NlpD
VIFTGWGGGYGNRTEISHGVFDGHSMVTTYNHQSQIATSSGASVNRGDVIGYVGTTGSSTGCHLHFEIYSDGSSIDPMPYLS